MTWTFFTRGSSIYWNEDPAVVEAAHRAASTGIYLQMFGPPGPIQTTDQHPTRLVPEGGQAWRLTPPRQKP